MEYKPTPGRGAACPQPDLTTGWDCGLIFGSAHSSGVNTVFCDGSVHALPCSIDPNVWHNLCARNDGQPVNMSEF